MNRQGPQRIVILAYKFLGSLLALEKRGRLRHQIVEHQIVTAEKKILRLAGQQRGRACGAHFLERLFSDLGDALLRDVFAEKGDFAKRVVFIDAKILLREVGQFLAVQRLEKHRDLYEAGLHLENRPPVLFAAFRGIAGSEHPERFGVNVSKRERGLQDFGRSHARRSFFDRKNGGLRARYRDLGIRLAEIRQQPARVA